MSDQNNTDVLKGINQAISWLRQNGEMKAANKLEKGICDSIR